MDNLREAAPGIDEALLVEAVSFLDGLPENLGADETWSRVSRGFLTPSHPFELHRILFQAVYDGWNHEDGPPAGWIPTPEEIESTNIAEVCRNRSLADFGALHAWSVAAPAEFWGDTIDRLNIRFRKEPTAIVDLRDGVTAPRWLVDARMNIAQSTDTGDDKTAAIVYQDSGGPLKRMSYRELHRYANRVGNSLLAQGLGPGDAVAIAMPMTVEAVAAYLGIVKAGMVVVSIADSFAPEEIATRLRIANARAVITTDVVRRMEKTLPMYQKIVAAGTTQAIVIPFADKLQAELREGDIVWDEFLIENSDLEAAERAAADPTNILFSSGTTGDPKAIPWTHVTPIKCAADAYYHHDVHPGDVVAWPTNLGWMMGPWLIYASLVNRATMAIFYGAPNTREFCEFVERAGVTMLGVVPSLVKAWRAADHTAGLDWTSIKAFSSTGEASNAEDMLWLMSCANYRPVVEYCGGTEIGGGYITQTLVQPSVPAAFSCKAVGLDFVLIDDNGNESTAGELFIVPPSIGLSNELLNRDHYEVYYEGTPAVRGLTLRRHGDEMVELSGGYYRADGRADDTMNLGGIKVSSAEIERALATLAGVVETAAIAVTPEEGGPSQLVIYAVVDSEAGVSADSLRPVMQKAVSAELNPLFRVYDVKTIDALPRTASNKVMRRVLRDQYVRKQ